MAPASARSRARWMPRLSPAGMATVSAGPANPSPTSRRIDRINPRRWLASWSVGTPRAISSAAPTRSEPLGELLVFDGRLVGVLLGGEGGGEGVERKAHGVELIHSPPGGGGNRHGSMGRKAYEPFRFQPPQGFAQWGDGEAKGGREGLLVQRRGRLDGSVQDSAAELLVDRLSLGRDMQPRLNLRLRRHVTLSAPPSTAIRAP